MSEFSGIVPCPSDRPLSQPHRPRSSVAGVPDDPSTVWKRALILPHSAQNNDEAWTIEWTNNYFPVSSFCDNADVLRAQPVPLLLLLLLVALLGMWRLLIISACSLLILVVQSSSSRSVSNLMARSNPQRLFVPIESVQPLFAPPVTPSIISTTQAHTHAILLDSFNDPQLTPLAFYLWDLWAGKNTCACLLLFCSGMTPCERAARRR